MAADATARAALALAALLFALALPWDDTEDVRCAAPAEQSAEASRTRAVSCAGGAPLRGPARLLYGLRLDPNRADAAPLAALPGIGAARADAIVAGRPYRNVAELARVPGIGPTTLSRIAPLLEVNAEEAGR